MLRRALLTAAITASALGAPSAAHAGTYEVLSCGAAGGVNHAWTAETGGGSITATDACGSGGAFPADDVFTQYGGSLGVYTTLGAPSPAPGAYGYWRFEVPDPLRIVADRIIAHGHSESDGWRLLTESDAGELAHCQTNEPGSGISDHCDIGGGSYGMPLGNSGTITPAKWIRISIRCTVAPCDTGSSAHAAGMAIYSDGETVSDPVAPSVGISPVTPQVSANGTVTATVSGSDQTGISRLELLVDGQVVASSARACDFTRVLPCEAPGATVAAALTSNGLTPGTHQIVARALDAAGNVASTGPQPVVAAQPANQTPIPTPTTPVPTTTPVPGSGSPTPTPTPGPGSTSTSAVKLKISTVSRSGSRVRVRGAVAKGCRSRLTIKLTAAGHTRSARLTVGSSGRWGVWLSGVRRHAKVRVKVSAKATGICSSGSASKSHS
ncbi:MAG: hypothetical protein AAGC46_09970 [Solirubrobacteraceae bacterium]